MPWLRWLLSLLLLTAVIPGVALAQGRGQQPPPPPSKEYRPLPYSGSLAEIYKEQILQTKGLDVFVELLNEIKKNPEKYKKLLNNKNLKSGDASAFDPEMLKLLQNPDGSPKYTLEQWKEMEQALKKLQEQSTSHKAPDPNIKPNGPSTNGSPTAKDHRPDPLAKVAEAIVKKMDQSTLSEKFPAFNKFKEDVMAGKTGTVGKGDFASAGLDDFLDVITKSSKANGGSSGGLPQAGPLEIPGGGGIPDVPSVPLVPDFGGIAGAAGGLTTTSVAGGGLALVQILLIVAVFVVVAVLVWKLLGRSRRQEPQVALATLGHWPVDPSRISTREQLVQAFEYLALLLLGRPARTANHRAIADSLGTTPETGQAADQLASLYEKARYDPVLGELPPADLTAARRDLLLLAGRRAPASGER
jgi:hypothetical protein